MIILMFVDGNIQEAQIYVTSTIKALTDFNTSNPTVKFIKVFIFRFQIKILKKNIYENYQNTTKSDLEKI